MSQHRLPLFRPEPPDTQALPGAPIVLPGRALAVLDPSDGGASLAFTAAFLRELARRGQVAPLVFAGFERLPQLALQRGRFEPDQPLHAWPASGDPARLAAGLGIAAQDLWVMVGQAALAFAPSLTILVGADVPLSRWPEPLRAARERIGLSLCGDGSAVAVALAAGLVGG